MRMFVEFDVDADIIDVPQSVIDNADHLRSHFLKWLYDKNVRHKYWYTFKDGSKGVMYRSDAFVEWLNKKVLKDSEQEAVIIEQHVPIESKRDLPAVFF